MVIFYVIAQNIGLFVYLVMLSFTFFVVQEY